jgi:hypothetical protein
LLLNERLLTSVNLISELRLMLVHVEAMLVLLDVSQDVVLLHLSELSSLNRNLTRQKSRKLMVLVS